MNAVRLALILHFEPENVAAAEGSPEARRVVDHWLHQLEHFDPLFAAEYPEAPALLNELLIETPSHEERHARVQADERFHHWGLCQHLLAEGERAAPTSAVLAWELTRLGVDVASRLDGARYHRAWTADLRAKAWCLLAEACRRLGWRDEAAQALGMARRHAVDGTKNPELDDRITRAEAAMRWRQAEAEAARPPAPAAPPWLGDEPSSPSQVV